MIYNIESTQPPLLCISAFGLPPLPSRTSFTNGPLSSFLPSRADVDTLQGRLGTFTEKTVEALEKLTADRRALQARAGQLADKAASLDRRLGFLSSNMTESQVRRMSFVWDIPYTTSFLGAMHK